MALRDIGNGSQSNFAKPLSSCGVRKRKEAIAAAPLGAAMAFVSAFASG
jgi:hypothetical protein